MFEIWHVDPSGIRAVSMVIGASPCHLHKADRGCAGGSCSVSLAFLYRADLLCLLR